MCRGARLLQDLGRRLRRGPARVRSWCIGEGRKASVRGPQVPEGFFLARDAPGKYDRRRLVQRCFSCFF